MSFDYIDGGNDCKREVIQMLLVSHGWRGRFTSDFFNAFENEVVAMNVHIKCGRYNLIGVNNL